MPKTYRPEWMITKWLSVTKYLKVALNHIDEIETSEQEVDFILNIIKNVEGREPINNLVEVLMSKAPVIPDAYLPRFAREELNFEAKDLDDLKHRRWEHEENYNRGRLPHDQYVELVAEIERREIRAKESNIQRIKPPSNPDNEAD